MLKLAPSPVLATPLIPEQDELRDGTLLQKIKPTINTDTVFSLINGMNDRSRWILSAGFV